MRVVKLLILLAFTLVALGAAAAPGDENWDTVFGLPGADGDIYTTVVYQGDLIIGGNFRAVGGSGFSNLARWDGTQWSAMGEPFNDAVNSLVVWNTELYAGGDFASSGATTVQGLARWDGSAWVEAGGGVDGGFVADLTVWDNRLVAAGTFDSVDGGSAFPSNIAAWDGSTWDELDGGTVGYPSAVIEYAGDLYMCGEFDEVGSTFVANLARWNGVTWSNIGGLRDEFGDQYEAFPADMTIHAGKLVIGGQFQKAGPVVVDGLAAWNGVSFSSYAGVSFGGNVVDVGVFDGDLVATDGFGAIMLWNNSLSWIQAGYTGGGVASTSDYAGDLIVAGSFSAISGVPCRSIGLNRGGWMPLVDGQGANSTVEVFHDWNGTLVVGGRFSSIGPVAGQVIAAWDGSAWTPLGSGIASGFGPYVGSLATFEGDLIVGGAFQTAGGVAAEKVARWDGTQWSAMGAGSSAGVSGLLALGGELYATGSWGGVQTMGRWDGTDFQPLGSQVLGSVQILNGLGTFQSQPVMVGNFTSVNNVSANNIARWDGAAWQALGTGTNGGVWDTCEINGLLYVGGSFTQAGGVPAVNVAVWDGSTWAALGTGLSGGRVFAVEAFGGDVYATGEFTLADGQAMPFVSRWDGTSWQGLGSGLNAEGHALGVFTSQLYIGGDFSLAGTTGSSRLARWSTAASAVEPSPLGTTRLFLSSARPNPFASRTSLAFSLAGPADVNIDVYDVRGARIRSLTRTGLSAGSHIFTWDGRNTAGTPVATGVYFVSVRDGHEVARRRVILMR